MALGVLQHTSDGLGSRRERAFPLERNVRAVGGALAARRRRGVRARRLKLHLRERYDRCAG